jgi:hypothetical protein
MSTIQDLVQQVRQDFLMSKRDLLALTKSGPEDVMRRLTAGLQLDAQAQDDVSMFVPLVDQKGFAGQVAREDFKRELGKAISRSFLRILRNGAIEFVAKLTDEAEAQYEDIEIAAGQRSPRAVVPPPPPPKSAQQQLEDEVVSDYATLSSDAMRKKMNSNVAYRETFKRLSDTDRLQSRVTTFTNLDAESR